MTEHSGGGDPARSIALLWRRPRKPSGRGRPPALDVDAIVGAAVALADERGLPALSMRALADALGVGTMTLYGHVPGKAELLDLMVDAVLGETAPEPARGSWRARLEQLARENAALYRRHPWLLDVATIRPPLGPNVIAKYDRELRALERIGLNDVEMDSVLSLVLAFVHGQVKGALEAAQVEQRSGLTDDAWWTAQEPLLAEVLDPERFPVAARVGESSAEAYAGLWDPDHAFEFGLERVLDGIAVLVESRR
jgi:AcrR family transcriptional regulator